ncbi:MAG: hypothetical protein JXA33_22690 [Anaerolineae bacterium]|nr:hypothetical protein [Anaerolineae bacterium]
MSIQQVQKKKRERKLLEEFRKCYPDFLVQTSSQVLGIELFEFHKKEKGERSSRIRQRESFHEQLAKCAQALFEAKYQIPLLVMLHGHGNQRSARPLELNDFADTIASLVEQHVPQIAFQDSRLDHRTLRDTPVARIVHSFTITRLRPEITGLWTFTETSWSETSFDELQQEITIKDAKLDTYLRQCSLAWLLIIVGGQSIATIVDFPRDLPQYPFQFRFERVLIYDRIKQTVVNLKRDR